MLRGEGQTSWARPSESTEQRKKGERLAVASFAWTKKSRGTYGVRSEGKPQNSDREERCSDQSSFETLEVKSKSREQKARQSPSSSKKRARCEAHQLRWSFPRRIGSYCEQSRRKYESVRVSRGIRLERERRRDGKRRNEQLTAGLDVPRIVVKCR